MAKVKTGATQNSNHLLNRKIKFMIQQLDLPKQFIDEIRDILGDNEANQLIESIQKEPSVSIRLNPHKGMNAMVWCALPFSEVYNEPYERVPWNSTFGIYLPKRPDSFTLDPLFHGAAYYVQEASSMALGVFKNHLGNRPIRALDLCAAPGGKATLLQDILPKGSMLVANEVIPNRAAILSENMKKWGYPNTIVTSADPKDLSEIGPWFDLILVDAPCSGEGMFRKDPEAIAEWSVKNVERCVERQREIIDNAWKMLKPGGMIIYSTCTYNKYENEDQVNYMLQQLNAEKVDLDTTGWPDELLKAVEPIKGAKTETFAMRFMPHRTKGEGLFMAAVKKPGELTTEEEQEKKKGSKIQQEEIPLYVKNWLKHPDNFIFSTMPDGIIHAIPKVITTTLEKLQKMHVRLLQAGIDFAEVKGKNYAPAATLAHSIELDEDSFDRVDICRTEAQHYLKREAITLANDANVGYIVITYAFVPLGFMKNIGNRANNLYPHEWKIRMELKE